MRYLLSTIWIVLSVMWISAVFHLGAMVGGVQWIGHTGQGPSAAIDILMAVFCLIAAIFLLVSSEAPKSLMIAIALLASIFFFNILGFIVVTHQYLQVTAPFVVKFFYLGLLLPTNPSFTNLIAGFVGLAILPGITLLASVASPTLHHGKRITLVTKFAKPYLLPIGLLILFFNTREVLTRLFATFIGNFLFVSTILSVLITSILIVIFNNLLKQNNTKDFLLAGFACVLSFPIHFLLTESNFYSLTAIFSNYRFFLIANSYVVDMSIVIFLPLLIHKFYKKKGRNPQ